MLAAIVWFTFEDYGLGWDDYTHSQYGALLLDYYASGLTDRRALSFVNLFMYGGGFDMAAALAAKILPYDLFETRRLIGGLAGLVGLVIVWRTARRLGGALAGLLALILLAACPMYYGHSFINAKDAPFAVAMAALLYAFVRLIADYPKPQPWSIAIFGVALGMTLGTRIMGGIASLFILLPFAMLIWHSAQAGSLRMAAGEFGHFLLRLLPAFVLAYAIMILVWPWAIQEPLNPIRAVGYFSHFFEKPWGEMFEGQVIPVPDMPRAYLPAYLTRKLPEILILLGLGGVLGALAISVRRELPIRWRASLVMLAMAFLVPVAITIATRPAMYNGIRHFIFLLPPLCILGGMAGAWMLQKLRDHSRGAVVAGAAIMSIGVALPVYDMVELHPYQYTHFNRSSGGVLRADKRDMLDYWGLSFKEATDELLRILEERGTQTPEGRRWVIAVCGPHPPAQLELGPDFLVTWNAKGADFALMLGEFYCAELDAPEIVKVEREGVIYARVYDIRGRTINDLFTVPPVTR